MKTFNQFINEVKVYQDNPGDRSYDPRHLKIIDKKKALGYEHVAIMGKGSDERLVFALNTYDKNLYKMIRPPSGTQLVRYATLQTETGGIFPLAAANLEKGTIHYNDEDAAAEDQINIEKKAGFKAQWTRLIK